MSDFGLSKIGQIHVNVKDVDRATPFYKETLGMSHLFQVPGMSFFDCDGIMLMLGIPTSEEFEHPSSILYYQVDDIAAAHKTLVERGVIFSEAPNFVANMGDQDLWMGFSKIRKATHWLYAVLFQKGFRLNNMVTHTSFGTWLNEYGRAWETGNPTLAVQLFSADAIYHEVPFDEPMTGQEAIRKYWEEGAEQSQTDIHFTYDILAVNGHTGIADWKASFTRLPSRNQVQLDGILTVQFDDQGKCIIYREWWHRHEVEEPTKP